MRLVSGVLGAQAVLPDLLISIAQKCEAGTFLNGFLQQATCCIHPANIQVGRGWKGWELDGNWCVIEVDSGNPKIRHFRPFSSHQPKKVQWLHLNGNPFWVVENVTQPVACVGNLIFLDGYLVSLRILRSTNSCIPAKHHQTVFQVIRNVNKCNKRRITYHINPYHIIE